MLEALIVGIYEAALLADGWPKLLEAIAEAAGAVGGVCFLRSPDRVEWTASPSLQSHMEDYVAEGWGADPAHAAPLVAELYPGFRAETDYRTAEEVERLPVHADFLAPRGLIAGAGTVLQDVGEGATHITFEGFRSHEAAQRAKPFLDRLRPHFGRACGLTAALQRNTTSAVVRALELAGLAAVLVDRRGQVQGSNDRFDAAIGDAIRLRRGRLSFADRFLQMRFLEVLADLDTLTGGVRSVGSRNAEGKPFVLHMVPIAKKARDRCDGDGILLILSHGEKNCLPGADLLRLLYDLTPAEARLARGLAEGKSLRAWAKDVTVSHETARSHLRGVFAKTGASRQTELTLLLAGLSGPLALPDPSIA